MQQVYTRYHLDIFKRFRGIWMLVFLLFIQTGCTKLVQVDPPDTSITGSIIFNDDPTAISVVTGIYMSISGNLLTTTSNPASLSLCPELSADELSLFGNNPPEVYFYQNTLTNTNNGGDFWHSFYGSGGMYTANTAIEGLAATASLSPAVKQQLMGEARFMRAFFYFYLVNLYGDVPLVTGTDYSVNRLLARSPKSEVWQQITTDLKAAESLLNQNYPDATLLNTTTERVRPTVWAASSLLARAYLYQQKWDSAVAEASKVITHTTLYTLDTLNGVFLKNSNEAIWQLQPVYAGYNTLDAILFNLPSSGPDGNGFPVYMSPELVNSFEPGDQRRTNWVDSVAANATTYYYPYKYKVWQYGQPVTEYTTILRLAEQYLIRAEAEAEQNDLTDAAADLNTIRARAGLPNTTASTQIDMLTAIYHERQVELFTEWGHRWFDLKRTGIVDSVMSVVTPLKGGGSWSSYKQLYPIALTELQLDVNLVQNPGY